MTLRSPVFVTGVNTGAGKTVFTAALHTWLQQRGHAVISLKPFSSGNREDAQLLYRLQQKRVPLRRINPFHFPGELAPLAAARRAGASITLSDFRKWYQSVNTGNSFLVLEGAGGLCSPLGEGISALEIIAQVKACTVVVAFNQLGVLNQVLLTVRALRESKAQSVQVVLMDGEHGDPSSASNIAILRELMPGIEILQFPWLGSNPFSNASLLRAASAVPAWVPARARISVGQRETIQRSRRAVGSR